MTPSFDPATLRAWIRTPHLDARVRTQPAVARALAQGPRLAARAFAPGSPEVAPTLSSDRLAVQRALYELNRLRLYWFDDPTLYVNERSRTLADLHAALEAPWQCWLASRTPRGWPRDADPRAVVRAWLDRDRTPTPTPDARWLAERMGLSGYRRLLEVLSLNGLVEASQLSRAVGGAASPVQATLFRILVEEYGAGRPAKKHSTYYAQMMRDLALSDTPERYLDRTPWQVLAAVNHAFHLSESKRHYLRFCGAFAHTEASTPASFHAYAAAAVRLGLSDGRRDYWSVHIREDARHGAWMIEQALVPLFDQFPDRAAEVLFGYAQQREVERMAGAATLAACRLADREEHA